MEKKEEKRRKKEEGAACAGEDDSVEGRYPGLWEPSLDVGVGASPSSLVFFSFIV